MPSDLHPKDFVREYGIRSLVCCFSAGKDSLVATHLVLSEVADTPLEKHVLLVDTTVFIPVALDFAKEISAQQGWPLTIVQPKQDFWTQARRKGMPWCRRRWCCEGLKLGPMRDFIRALPPQRAAVTGLRRDESERRRKIQQVIYDRRRGVNCWNYAPLADWTEKDVLSYIKAHNLPMPPHYRMGFKETCMCGTFCSKKEILILKAYYPEIFQKFVDLEKDFRNKTWSAFWDHGQVWARDLAKQKHLTEAAEV